MEGHTVVLSPLPFRDPDRLVWLQEVDAQGRARPPLAAHLAEWKKASQTIENADLLGGISEYSLAGQAGGQRVRFINVGLATLATLGVEPILGRTFHPDEAIVEADTAQTIVISHHFWQTRFGGDPGVIGQPMPGWKPRGAASSSASCRPGSGCIRRWPTRTDGSPSITPGCRAPAVRPWHD